MQAHVVHIPPERCVAATTEELRAWCSRQRTVELAVVRRRPDGGVEAVLYVNGQADDVLSRLESEVLTSP